MVGHAGVFGEFQDEPVRPARVAVDLVEDLGEFPTALARLAPTWTSETAVTDLQAVTAG